MAFAYDPVWLAATTFDLDAGLDRHEGEQRPSAGHLFGVFSDTAPDRWGRALLIRREAHAARREDRHPRTLDDWDFLTGVRDDLRAGAIRLRRGEDPVAAPGASGVPPMTRLRELQYYASRVERSEDVRVDEEETETALLLAPGSSLGGARPKGVFATDDGALWIAKFPSAADLRDVGAWEFVMNRLAALAGIPVPETQLLEVLGRHRTFCARRFDRSPAGRLMFVSGMTLTGKRDGDVASYLDIAEAIEDHGDPRAIEEDLAQLFRRAAFAIVTAHRDDHLRNHGFLHTGRGWRPSPAFDLNPIPEKPEHTLTFDEHVATPDIDVLLGTAKYYRLTGREANAIVDEVRLAVRGWRDVARAAGITRDAIALMGGTIRA